MDPVTLGMANAAAKRALEPVGFRVVSQRGKIGSSQSNGTDLTQKSRTRWVIRGACGEVVFVFSNFYLPSGGHESPNPYTVTVTICVEDPTTNAGDAAGTLTIPVFFNGKRNGVLEASGILISDPVAVNVPDGGVVWLRCSPAVASGDKWVNALSASNSPTAIFDGGGVSEGMLAGNSVIDSGTIGVGAGNVFGPTMILGRAAAGTRKPSVLIVGDSIAAETNIITSGDTSYMTRACMLAGYATTRISEGGERLFQIIAASTAWKRWRLARHCTHVISNYGVNDIYSSARTLAQVKADALTMFTMWQRLGLKVFQLTVLPRLNASTDGYMTVAGQSITDAPKEAIRAAFNDWLLDNTSSGAKTQSGGALVGVLDPCALIEVNAAGVLTHNGGFWAVPGGAVVTGTATGYTTTTITDTGAARTVMADVGKVIAITSATTGAGQAAAVTSNTATTWTFGALTLPTGTVTYQLGASYFVDGTHPSETAHDLIGNALSVDALTI